MIEVTRCAPNKNSQTSKAETIWKIYPVWGVVDGAALRTVMYAFAIKNADRNQKQR